MLIYIGFYSAPVNLPIGTNGIMIILSFVCDTPVSISKCISILIFI